MRKTVEQYVYESYDASKDHIYQTECYQSNIHAFNNCPNVTCVGSWNVIVNNSNKSVNNYALSNNLISNGSFEIDLSGWNYASISNWNYSTAVASRIYKIYYDGNYSVKCGDGTNAGKGIALSSPISVIPSSQYALNFYVYSTNASTQYIVLMRCYDINGNDISSSLSISGWIYSPSYQALYFSNSLGSTSTWINVNKTLSIPSNVYSVSFSFQYYTGGDYYVYFDRISFVPIVDTSYVIIPFSGTQIFVGLEKNIDCGQVYYSLDNGQETLVDLYDVRQSYGVVYWLSLTGLSAGDHILKIRTASTKNPSSHSYNIILYYYTTASHTFSITTSSFSNPKPKIYIEPIAKKYSFDFKGKVSGSTIANANKMYTYTGSSAPTPSSTSWTEVSQYKVSYVDNIGVLTSTNTSGYYAYQMFEFNLGQVFSDVNILKNNLQSIQYEWYGVNNDTTPLHYIWNGSTWVSLTVSPQAVGVSSNLTSNLSSYIDSNGKVYILVRSASSSNGSSAVSVHTDYVKLTISHKYAKNPYIISKAFNILANPKPTGKHQQVIPEWDWAYYTTPYNNLYDAKEEALLVQNINNTNGRGQLINLELGATYTISFKYKAPYTIEVFLYFIKPSASAVVYNYAYVLYFPASTDYRRATYTFLARFPLMAIWITNYTSNPATSYLKEFVLSKENYTSYREPQKYTIQIGSATTPVELQGNDIIIINAADRTITKNSVPINTSVSNDFWASPLTLLPTVNHFYVGTTGAIKLTLVYEE